MKLFKFVLVLGLCALNFQAFAQKNDNDALNQFYKQFSVAFEQLDAAVIQDIYAENACYIPEQQNKEITMGRDNIIELYKRFFGKIKHKNAQIEVDFRVVERQLDKQQATDVGYYLIRFYPPKETEEPVSEFAGKFVTVSKKKADGKWYLTVDTNNRSEPSFYYSAKPLPNLYYGRQFSTLNESSSNHD
ncbi:DUF4440 domain-containing protein [Shewanella loihica]|uniref:Uncharacterized protein n=1 Tax=Shewanella loihica (strain ATCC BAA-1088 / PV-4) TaxID=323850 RepID=A3QEM3_SHELP|nr:MULTISPECIES: DUF4440 domain-containing protein [Shewanella]ABO23921.1 conserved hypothetical protein [Shewanella loihica PV-4]QYJ96007.1 DUF4440 domain-containing protein [Shewanella alkalitolerans]